MNMLYIKMILWSKKQQNCCFNVSSIITSSIKNKAGKLAINELISLKNFSPDGSKFKTNQQLISVHVPWLLDQFSHYQADQYAP